MSQEQGEAIIIEDAERFTELRRHFHDLLAMEAPLRASVVDGWRSRDPNLAAEMERLLAALDERDLYPTESNLPQQIGPFRVLHRLGRGGMGEVFLAERNDATFEQRVAVKLIAIGGFSAELTQRFLRERQILARLSHPGIAHLVDGGFDDNGVPWLAMEYVDGLPLGRWVAANQPSLLVRVRLVRQIALAVAFAHGHLVVHRDLKPANILVTADGTPKLLDFGIAKMLDETDAASTRTGMQALTVRYAAPEQLAGDRICTATDVHALGVLLQEIVTERSPWPQAEAGLQPWHQAILQTPAASLLDAALPLTSSERSRVGGDLQRIVSKALAKTAADRYAGAAAFADDLDDWLADRPLRSGIGSRQERSRQFLRRHRWPLLLIVGVLAALSIGLLVALREAALAARQRVIAEENLDAMLGVLGAAVPRDFQARQVPASEFLLHVAERLQVAHGGNPELIRRALGEIGVGLINLGEGDRAESILLAAIAASERNGDAVERQLALYKLLVFSQDGEDAIARAESTAQRIGLLAGPASTPAGVAIDALASAAGVMSRHGRFDLADPLFKLADHRRSDAGRLPPEALENFWRQRGWSAWRAYQLDASAQHLGQAAALMHQSPNSFSPLRRAELQQLLAEVETARGNASAASTHLQAATATFESEYPIGHTERAMFQIDQARVALLENQPREAVGFIDRALVTLTANYATHLQLRGAHWFAAQAHAAAGECRAAIAGALRADAIALSTTALPRERQLEAASRAAVTRDCGSE